MRVVFGILFTAVVLIIVAQFAIAGFLGWQCYDGNERACMMISEKHDITLKNR